MKNDKRVRTRLLIQVGWSPGANRSVKEEVRTCKARSEHHIETGLHMKR